MSEVEQSAYKYIALTGNVTVQLVVNLNKLVSLVFIFVLNNYSHLTSNVLTTFINIR